MKTSCLGGAATAALLAGAISACGDATGSSGDYLVTVDTLSVYAINGSPLSAPTGLLVGSYLPAAVVADGNAAFDLALDIDSLGRAVLLPVTRVLASFIVTREVLLQTAGSDFEALTAAPEGGYAADTSALTVTPNVVVVVRAQTDWCYGQTIDRTYAKLVVDSIDVADRRIDLRVATNPNCGVRSLVPGAP
jgi:hypothetical protein